MHQGSGAAGQQKKAAVLWIPAIVEFLITIIADIINNCIKGLQ